MAFFRPSPAAAKLTARVAVVALFLFAALPAARWGEQALKIANPVVDTVVSGALLVLSLVLAKRAGAYVQRRVMADPS